MQCRTKVEPKDGWETVLKRNSLWGESCERHFGHTGRHQLTLRKWMLVWDDDFMGLQLLVTDEKVRAAAEG